MKRLSLMAVLAMLLALCLLATAAPALAGDPFEGYTPGAKWGGLHEINCRAYCLPVEPPAGSSGVSGPTPLLQPATRREPRQRFTAGVPPHHPTSTVSHSTIRVLAASARESQHLVERSQAAGLRTED